MKQPWTAPLSDTLGRAFRAWASIGTTSRMPTSRLALRPGSTAANVKVATHNSSEAYLQNSGKIVQQMIELGLPES